MRKKVVFLSLIIIMLFVGCGKTTKETKEINISVAASLAQPITEIAKIYEASNNVKININSGASGRLKKQIIEGADIGLFFSANEKYVDELVSEGLALEANKVNAVNNKIVLIKYNNPREERSSIEDLVNLNGKIAIGEISTVPAGQYAKQALKKIEIWDKLQDKVVYCKDVSAVKTYVEKGEVDYGFIYKSDATNLQSSLIVEEVNDNLHDQINYSLIPIEGYKYNSECKELINLILSNDGKEILKSYGFEVRE